MIAGQFAFLAYGVGAFVLITSGLVKALDRERFERVLLGLPATRSSAAFLSATFPPFEIGAGALLLFGQGPLVGPLVASVVFLALAAVSHWGSLEECGCGPFVPTGGSSRVAMSAAIAGALVWSAAAASTPTVGERFLGLGAAAVVGFVVLATNGLADARKEWGKP